MNIFQKIKAYLTGKQSSNVVLEGYCPNCWGRQEYEGNFLEAIRNEKIDLNNIDQKKGWIEAYAIKNFEGIRLKKEDSNLVCAACELSYKPGA